VTEKRRDGALRGEHSRKMECGASKASTER
jgi:hypothetical protein